MFGSRSLWKLSGYTSIELVIIENPDFVVVNTTLSVIVPEVQLLPVLEALSRISVRSEDSREKVKILEDKDCSEQVRI